MAFQTLNRLKWTGRLGRCSVEIIHRGAPGDRKFVGGEKVTQVKRGHFNYLDGGKERFIPLHRVMRIRLDGEVVWERRAAGG